MGKLTAKKILNAKSERSCKLSDGHGLYFVVSRTGKKVWLYRFKIAGQDSSITLGGYPELSLAEARAERVAARKIVAGGQNPVAVRRAKRQEARQRQEAKPAATAGTVFHSMALEWIEQQRGKWSVAHVDNVLASLQRDVFPAIGHKSIDGIQPPEILKIIKSVESRGALDVAKKNLQRVTAIFRLAVQTGRIKNNPAAEMRGCIKTKKVSHHAAITQAELPAFLHALSVSGIDITTKLAFQFLLHTAARTGEVRGAVWSEIDWQTATWSIPAHRMKTGRRHDVPLSRQTLGILERMGNIYGREPGAFIFPGIHNQKKMISVNTLLYAIPRFWTGSKITVHGFRATFSSVANEAGHNGDVIEKCLSHTQQNRVRAAYHRAEYREQRREVMQWWGDLLQKMEAQGSGKI